MAHENGGNVALETNKYQANAAIMIDDLWSISGFLASL
jgi:hypothetical protein